MLDLSQKLLLDIIDKKGSAPKWAHALSNVCEIIESALLQRGYCLAISLDCKGAFNEISFESVLKNMK